jgi:hypothetical protein
MRRIVRLTESDLSRIVKRVINEQDENAQADEVVKNLNTTEYCKSGPPPTWVTNTLNKLPKEKLQEAKDFIKKFVNIVKGKTVKELLALRRQIKQEKQKAESNGVMNEQFSGIIIAGVSISATVLIVIGAIILFVIIAVIVIRSSKGGGGSCNPGWWDDL